MTRWNPSFVNDSCDLSAPFETGGLSYLGRLDPYPLVDVELPEDLSSIQQVGVVDNST
jgi:hypothetical protein